MAHAQPGTVLVGGRRERPQAPPRAQHQAHGPRQEELQAVTPFKGLPYIRPREQHTPASAGPSTGHATGAPLWAREPRASQGLEAAPPVPLQMAVHHPLYY